MTCCVFWPVGCDCKLHLPERRKKPYKQSRLLPSWIRWKKGGSAWFASSLWSRRNTKFLTSQSCFLSSNWLFRVRVHPFNWELKHLTFLIHHERHGWPRRTGSGTRFACQMQISKQNNVKPSRTPTEWISWKCFSKICVKFCFEENLILDEEFLLSYDEYSSKNPEFEPLVSTWELACRSPWLQLEKVFTCAMAVVLQKYFRLASVVPRPSGA